jgi:NAD(P) transhydrogenase subunit alpha
MDLESIKKSVTQLLALTKDMTSVSDDLYKAITTTQAFSHSTELLYFTIFLLSCFIGYYLVWNVKPSLHSVMVALSNVISSVIIVGAIIGASSGSIDFSHAMSLFGIFFASINIVGGFFISQRMIQMFEKESNESQKQISNN